MTVVVFKNGVLAADKRRTVARAVRDNHVCGHCSKVSLTVDDTRTKIRFARKGMFRGEKIIATAAAGSSELLGRLQACIAIGDNIEEVHANYLKVFGSRNESEDGCTLMLIGVNKNYVVRVPKMGSLQVTVHEKKEFLAIGSGRFAAIWVDKLLPRIEAVDIVNLAMHEDDSVGGGIDYVDFSKEKPEIEKHDHSHPGEMIEIVRTVFERGLEAGPKTK